MIVSIALRLLKLVEPCSPFDIQLCRAIYGKGERHASLVEIAEQSKVQKKPLLGERNEAAKLNRSPTVFPHVLVTNN